ncbi:MAG: hypothetical protein AAF788_05315 [Pseudomonadota bacterium]
MTIGALSFGQASAAVSVLTFDTHVTSIEGGAPGDVYQGVLNPGDQVEVVVEIDDSVDITTDPEFLLEASVTIKPDDSLGNALIQTCCTSAPELDPADGVISFSGFLGGFTLPAFISDPLIPSSGDAFLLEFSVSDADTPVAPFSSTQDLIDFFGLGSLTLIGFVANEFSNEDDSVSFIQQVNFASAEPEAIPLPAAGLLFLGAAGFALRRQQVHAH